MSTRTPYPSDVADDEWEFVAPYLTLLSEDAGQRTCPLCEVWERPALPRAHRRPLAHAPARLPALGGSGPADVPLVPRRPLRGHRPRPAAAPAHAGGPRGTADRRDPGQPDGTIDARERRPGGR